MPLLPFHNNGEISNDVGRRWCHNASMTENNDGEMDVVDVLGEGGLARVTYYASSREGEHFDIRVHEVLTGRNKGRFIAVPYLVVFGDFSFYGEGTSGEEALEQCLNKIKGVPIEDIFPRLAAHDSEDDD
jgi:hypothetical protein